MTEGAGPGGSTSPERSGADDERSARRGGRHVGWWPYAAMAALVVVALVIGADRGSGPPSDSERVFALSRSIACPQCDGQTVSESETPLAKEIRAEIARRVDAGETDQQIRDYFARTQGEEILLTPPSEGVGGLVWVIPVAGAIIALAALAAVFWRWKARPRIAASADDRALVARALDETSIIPDDDEGPA